VSTALPLRFVAAFARRGPFACGLSLRADAFEQNRGWLVVWVLRYEFAFECALENRLAQTFRALEVVRDEIIEFVDDCQSALDFGDDAALLS
jgi:hypothetical protein